MPKSCQYRDLYFCFVADLLKNFFCFCFLKHFSFWFSYHSCNFLSHLLPLLYLYSLLLNIFKISTPDVRNWWHKKEEQSVIVDSFWLAVKWSLLWTQWNYPWKHYHKIKCTIKIPFISLQIMSFHIIMDKHSGDLGAFYTLNNGFLFYETVVKSNVYLLTFFPKEICFHFFLLLPLSSSPKAVQNSSESIFKASGISRLNLKNKTF